MSNTFVDVNFPITVYGNLEKFTDVMSLGRCRIFYKYGNRNGTYITDEFAEELIKTLPYTPVKGIYEEENGDFADHGEKRSLGRIYGIVPGPQDMGFAWEKHVDEDGIEREYACVNVYYYTALYEEAGKIPEKGQSMELYRKSVRGDWKIIEGKRYYVFEKASFLGLQVLGDEVEPCFEGAAFFSLYQSVKSLYEKLEEYQSNFQKYGEGGNTMPDITFKVSDREKYDFLWAILNPNFNEENGWAVECSICDIYDEYAIVRNHVEATYERVYYAKNNETDSLEITNREQCFIVDVNASEKSALEMLHRLNGNTYELLDEKYNDATAKIGSLEEEILTHSTKIEELNGEIATLTTNNESVNQLYTDMSAQCESIRAEYAAAQELIATLTAERDELATYRKNIEDTAKRDLINGYSEQLEDDVLNSYLAKIDEYTLKQLDMELTYEVKNCHPEMFSKATPPAYIPKQEAPKGGIESILAKYEKH